MYGILLQLNSYITASVIWHVKRFMFRASDQLSYVVCALILVLHLIALVFSGWFPWCFAWRESFCQKNKTILMLKLQFLGFYFDFTLDVLLFAPGNTI